MTIPATDIDEVEVLVLRARSGEPEAFGELVERFWAELVALARAVLATDEPAEDLVEDALIHAWQRLWTLRRPKSFAVWIRRIVTRRCISWARRNKRSLELGDYPAYQPEPGAGFEVARLLARLAPRQRAVLYLTWIEGCTDRETGRVLGLRPATVRVHRFRGLRRLQQIVGKLP